MIPVFGGFAVLLLIFGATWGIAAWISRGGAESTPRLAPTSFRVGNVTSVADRIEESGPMLFPGLNTTRGERTIVLDHTGDDPTRGYRVYLAYPADADASCGVEQVRQTHRYTDCEGREIEVGDLAAPLDVCPVVENREAVSIDLTCGAEDDDTTTTIAG